MVNTEPDSRQEVIDAYRQRASGYNFTLRLFDLFSWFGFNISGWRKQAISALHLKPGDTVVDIGCGTGNNFPLLHQAVGPNGTIIGVDLSEAMIAQARKRIAASKWENVKLVCADAAEFEFPLKVDAVLSTYALTLVPDCGRIISNACQALVPEGRLAILDMAWPRYCPLWWRHILFFLRSYGVTAEVIRRRPWEIVQKSMIDLYQDISTTRFWFGFFYLACGTARSNERGPS
jgi:demethylmenaquinone methyltransferase/2-methoxy-6-polyprenyl-1,4-benzoquinol methylase